MIIGYARSTDGTVSLDHRAQSLRDFGCDQVFVDGADTRTLRLPGLADAMLALRPKALFVSWDIACVGQSATDIDNFLKVLRMASVEFATIRENVSTCSSAGLKALGALTARLASRERGEARNYRLRSLDTKLQPVGAGDSFKMTPEKLDRARALIAHGTSISNAAREISVARSTLYRYMAATKNREIDH